MQQDSSIIQAFERVYQTSPHAVCLHFEHRSYTYKDVRSEVLHWAHFLYATQGVRAGDRVALFLENSPAFLAAYLGAHSIGAIVVLVNTQYKQVELRHILSDASVSVCITDADLEQELDRVADAVPGMKRVVVTSDVWGIAATDVDTFDDLQLPQWGDIALIAYTSGTTGRSKGAMLLHRNLAANSRAVTQAWHWTANDRLLLTLPLFHIHGLGVGIHGTLLTGASVELRRRFDARDVYDTLANGSATMFFGVPTMYTRLIAEAQSRQQTSNMQSVRLFVSGSAPLSPQTFGEFEALFGQRILERYGMTETVMNLTNPYDGERRPGTVGMPFPGQEARIADVRTRQPIDDETPGEIQVRGPHVFKGYWERPDATEEAFDAEGWFNTGDLGWRSDDGYYTISGRARELIISGGYNIYPREIEEVLLAHSAVAEAAVLGAAHPEFGEQVVAVLVLNDQYESHEDAVREELVAWCRDQLAAYKKPRQIVFVQSLPRNALGKVQKHLIKETLSI